MPKLQKCMTYILVSSFEYAYISYDPPRCKSECTPFRRLNIPCEINKKNNVSHYMHLLVLCATVTFVLRACECAKHRVHTPPKPTPATNRRTTTAIAVAALAHVCCKTKRPHHRAPSCQRV